MSKTSSRASKKNVTFTAEQLEVAARRFRLKSGVRAGKNSTGGKSGGKAFGAPA